MLVPTLRSDVLAADALPVLWDAAKAFLTLEENAALSIEVLDTTQTADESGSGMILELGTRLGWAMGLGMGMLSIM